MTGVPTSRPGRHLLLYGMYDLAELDSAPKVRIALMRAALERAAPLAVITGGRGARARTAFRWLLDGSWRNVGAVYVESSTSTATPADLAFLGLMRLAGRPVGVYFRDAYQLFRETYPITRRRQRLMDWLWRLTMPLMRTIASHRFVPTAGLAGVLGIRDPIFLPPGTDPLAPDLGAGAGLDVGYVGSLGWADGFDRLLEAMEIVRQAVPAARLRVIGPALSAERRAALPAWVDIRRGGRDTVVELLRDVRACVIPRPITPYTDFAAPIKLWDYLSLGKPVVATGAAETRAVLEASGGGLVTGDRPEDLAAGLRSLLEDEQLARSLGARARAYAVGPGASWDARARQVISTLGPTGG